MMDLIVKEVVPEVVKVVTKKAVELAAEHPVETAAVFGLTYAAYQKGRADTLEEIVNIAPNAQRFN